MATVSKEMTHEELLAKIDEEGEFLVQHFDSKPKVHSALRAVVELHKPDMRGNCDICSWIIGKPGAVHYSVCPTIQAIEKELG